MFHRLKSYLSNFFTATSSDHNLLQSNVRLSIVTQFYPPDFAATGQFVDELAQQLSHQNMEVQVFTGQPSYAFDTEHAPDVEMMGNVQVTRSHLLRSRSRKMTSRTLSSLAFCWHTAMHLLNRKHRGDILLFTSEPPFLQVVGYIIKLLFKTPYACLVYDLYPEVAVELKVVSKQHGLVYVWDWVNRLVWNAAESIIVPCQTMKDRIVAKVPEVANKITVIHNWADPTWIKPLAKPDNAFAQTHNLVKPFTVLYSGNMGRCHDMDTILDAAWELRHEPVQFVFIGGGPKRDACIERIQKLQLTNCQFLPYQDKALLPQSLTACDLSLVSVDVGMEGLVAPSKFYSALSSGRPVAVVCEKHSYLRSLVADANCGAAFNNGDSKGLAGFIRYLAKDSDMTERLGKAGHRYIHSYFTPQRIGKQYFKILQRAVLKHADLYHAVDQQQFEVYYQPIVSLATGKVTAFEALVRWHHPMRGLICPAEFMAAAEETGLVVPMGWWLLEEVTRQLQQWQDCFPESTLRVCINLSSQQFFHPELIPHIDELLERYSLTGHCLVLEIKDRMVMEDAAATTAILFQLQTRGIQVCIDDFGVSYQALDYLHHFPVGILKIDRTLTSRIGVDNDTVKLIETVLILARDLGMEPIAEGIETLEQLRRIKELGFNYGQGHLFSKPLNAQAIAGLLKHQEQVNFMDLDITSSPSEQDLQSSAPLVLIVDDDRSIRTILKIAISKEGYRVVEAKNGQQAIGLYHELRPDLVLLDAMMPEMDGFACCAQLQSFELQPLESNPDTVGSIARTTEITQNRPPILMITALEDTESVEKAFAAGATDYITKPVNWAVLRQRLRQFFQ
jgi:EAL domain-containing protein (putative c-di-GMP-specific phosphodiesterase class I)/glycosyltransferase involved in cell wall biosynthesis/AmiR/NasT family two-component response regulator